MRDASAQSKPSGERGSDAGGERGPSRLVVIEVLVFVLSSAYLGWRSASRLIAAWAFSTDDAFISLRYARHLLAGHGLVWNVGGPRVEGYSNLSFVVFAAACAALGEPGVVPLKILGCAGLGVTVYLQWAIARRFVAPVAALIPAAIYTCARGVLWWTVSGLETSAYTALTCAIVLFALRGMGFERVPASCAGVATRRSESWRARDLGVAGALCMVATVTRPEGPLLWILVFVAVIAQAAWDGYKAGDNLWNSCGRVRRSLYALMLCFLPSALLYFGWRVFYFGELVPHSVLCKSGYDDRFVLLRDYWQAAGIVVVAALLHPLRELDARVLLPATIAAAYALALIGADPVVAHDLRHFLPAHSLVCVLAATGALRVASSLWAGEGSGGRWISIGLLVVLLATASSLGQLPSRDSLHQRAAGYAKRGQTRAALGKFLTRELGEGEAAVLGDVGVAGWVSERDIIDAFCLNEPAMTQPALAGSSARAADWLLSQAPALIVVHSKRADAIEARGAIYRELIERPNFVSRWREVSRFVTEGGRFHYFVFAPKGEQ
ncbi:hypothetical protein G6O69_30725 [Pseudenhygromyxa sp. WMMC2535]|uniref:hypothetical protein n=1 Tax=Pseudenhygromyxa sp. WMMC2535 TaxID=2712867 RepID=UPI001555FAC9|nr:hypothetical protein [Pseudenhygromyxa sp. WMMC2535]NVB42238.1 hypothetical protein [Pseudenhygromyxa sp. WMMC2535]